MAPQRRLVTIKGVKDGLVFHLDDDCEFQQLIEELREKITSTHQKILTGPDITVQVRLGNRYCSDEQKQQLTEIIQSRDNLSVTSFEADVVPKHMLYDETGRLKEFRTIVRSGQTLFHNGDILLIGDVNPGGTVSATGDIYVMGSLRGIAHAGIEGREDVVIAASHMRPTQLRIASVISRPPDEWGVTETFMEFAYLADGVMKIDKMAHIGRVRPDGVAIKGE